MVLMRRALFIALFLFAPFMASASLIPTNAGNLELVATPQYPQPGESTALIVNNTTGDAAVANYVWSVNGKTVLSGIGQNQLSLVAPTSGQDTVDVTVTDASGAVLGTLSTIINPATVDIVWEGQTSVPPLYIGRPLPNGASPITVLAVPHIAVGGATVPDSSLIYTWSVNSIPKAAVSGYGKSSATITPPNFGQAFTVSIHAETADGRGGADGSATIQPQTPTALIYQNAPLLGMRFDKIIAGSFPMSETEASFIAYPLFVNNPTALTEQWTLNGAPFSVDPSQPQNVTFRKTGSGSGTSAVAFSFNNPSGFLESGSASFTLTF